MKTNKQSTEQEAKRNKCLEWIKNDPKLSAEFNAMTPEEQIKRVDRMIRFAEILKSRRRR